MTDPHLADRLAALPSLASVPRAELEWLAAHGELKRYAAGDTLYSSASPPPGCYVVVSGSLSVRVVRDGLARTVNEVRTGDISGRLPYSRMATASGGASQATPHFTSVAEEPTEILLITDAKVREMVRECYEVTAQCVHQMVDRARLFKLDDLQREKMASLGRLAAGLAHELNNPSSAAARSALVMDACRRQVVTATRALAAAGLADDELALVEALDAKAEAAPEERSSLDAADREEAVFDWLEARGLDAGMAESLARASISVADLDAVASALPSGAVEAAMRYVATNAMANQLITELERATRRIDLLVAAVKRHTHMDRAPVVEPIDVEPTLADTLVIAESKARAKQIVLTLDIEPGLPRVPGVAGQLNDVWMNLVDNATDAAPTGGQVTVSARRGPDVVVVSVTDNGPGIPAADQTRVFEPFFTTKPVGQGAGLGLDVVQRVVRSHGGAVELHSTPGHTEFQVTLPATTAPPAAR